MTARSALVAAALLASVGGAAGHPEAILVTDVNVVDIGAGTVARGQSILIEDGSVAGVGADFGSASAERYDAGGAYVIPGLWEQPRAGGYLSAFRTFGGFTLPTHVGAGNDFGTEAYFPFFIADVHDIRFPVPERQR